MERIAIVARARGSWRWQNAYGVVAYQPRRLKDGRYVWTSARNIVWKLSSPQLYRTSWPQKAAQWHSLHNSPLSTLESWGAWILGY